MPKRPQQELSALQLDVILAEVMRRHPRVAVAAQFMALLGLRIGEARQVRWSWIRDLRSTQPILDIPKDRTKTRWPRSLPIPPALHATLLALHRRASIAESIDPPGDWPVVLNRWGKPPSSRYIQKTLAAASEKVIGVRIRPHTLRHTFANNLLKKTNLRVVQKALGHRSITSTEIYTHPNLTDLREAIEAAAILRPEGDTAHAVP